MRDTQLVIFDLDGTILDTLEDLKDALNYALSALGYPPRSLEEVRRFVGNGIGKLIERALPETAGREAAGQVRAVFAPYYQAHCKDKTRPYPGIVELVTRLRERGYRTAVVSNKPDGAVKELCREYFPGLFDHAAGEKPDVGKKPAPDSVLAAMAALGADRAVYIGDSEVDIQTAENAGLDCVLVTWGFRDRDFLAGQGGKRFVDAAGELLALFPEKAPAFRPMRRAGQALDRARCEELLTQAPRGVLAVHGEGGYPYALPMDFLYQDGKLYFHCAKEGHKLDALAADSRACFCVMDQGFRKDGDWALNISSVIAFGRVRRVEDPGETGRLVRALGVKYYPTPEAAEAEVQKALSRVLMLEMTVDHMTGKLVNES